MNPNSKQSNTPPPWFDAAIRHGLATLYAMGLESMPAADTVAVTSALWVDDLWTARPWAEVDAERIAEAFRVLRRSVRRWPQQADFLAALPARALQELPRRAWTDDELQRNRQRLAALVNAIETDTRPN